MKTKLLRKLRRDSQDKFGVFKENGTYTIVFDRAICPDVGEFDRNLKDDFQILNEEIESLEAAKNICDDYRRRWILDEVRKLRYKSVKENRFY